MPAQTAPGRGECFLEVEGVLRQQEEENEWKKAMEKKPKLRTYRTIKENLKLEDYLKVNTNPKSRQTLTNLRTGSNNLRIETGRWTRPREAIEDRLCMECMNGSVEDVTRG